MGITVGLHLSKINMKSFTIAAVLCLASSTYGAPQGRRFNIQNVPAQPLTAFKTSTAGSQNGLFPLPSSGPIVTNVPNQGPSIDTAFGAFPLGTKHFMTRQERNQYLPVMRALEKVMATSTPAPEDVNTLLVLTRDLAAQIPEGESLPSFLGAGFGGFGLNGLESMGLAKTGDVIVQVDNVPYIVTQFGAFPLSTTSLMTDEERAKFLPSVRTFISVLEKDTLDPAEINQLLEQARDITPDIDSGAGGLGGLGGGLLGQLLGGFGGGLGGFGGSSQSSQSNIISNRRPAASPVVSSGSSGASLSTFGIPATGPLIENVPNQGPSFNFDFGKLPLDSKNLMTAEERSWFLPVMKALLKVMDTPTPAPEDINTLLVLSRDLTKYIPEGSAQFGAFANLDGIESMGLPETGDVIKYVNGEPHIETQFGAFPLSEVSLMTDEERQRFLPATRTFISVLQKDTVDPSELNTLLEQSRELTNLIPDNLLSQFTGGLGGLGGLGR